MIQVIRFWLNQLWLSLFLLRVLRVLNTPTLWLIEFEFFDIRLLERIRTLSIILNGRFFRLIRISTFDYTIRTLPFTCFNIEYIKIRLWGIKYKVLLRLCSPAFYFKKNSKICKILCAFSNLVLSALSWLLLQKAFYVNLLYFWFFFCICFIFLTQYFSYLIIQLIIVIIIITMIFIDYYLLIT